MKALILLTLLTACGSETDKSLAKKVDAYDSAASTSEAVMKTDTQSGEQKPADDSKEESIPAVKISRPDGEPKAFSPEGCGDFEIDGDFRAAADSRKNVVLSVKMNNECDSATFRYINGQLDVTMCSNNTEWLLANRTVKTKVTEIAIVREGDQLWFEYRSNGKTEKLEYMSVSGELMNPVAVCLEKAE